MCILNRSLNFYEGLVNGTKLIIQKIHRHHLLEVFIPGQESITHLIPRMIFKSTAGNSGIEILRRQFPIRLAYARTINKSQGQTLDMVGVDLGEHVFAHGQLYVALSRAREFQHVTILTRKSRMIDEVTVGTMNIVYKELLD
nr:PREDICTED: ATP-dependent DNA helicase PIF1-like [Bemisia tabaci]